MAEGVPSDTLLKDIPLKQYSNINENDAINSLSELKNEKAFAVINDHGNMVGIVTRIELINGFLDEVGNKLQNLRLAKTDVAHNLAKLPRIGLKRTIIHAHGHNKIKRGI